MIDRLQPAVRALCSAAIRRNRDLPLEAGDLVSDVNVELWTHRDRLLQADRPEALAQTIATRVVRRNVKRAKRVPLTCDGELAHALNNCL
jgi:DNA-directed RNA polymerase specialized sigma24 family protein